ncbi:MAG: UDP-N-acetylmuramoyl-L-alanyl-D-glutamate--2,6-diaminopimelate ligase [bacterium]
MKKFNYKNFKRRLINNLLGFHFFRDPYKKLKIIAVTGTNGKTTTATLLYKIATELGYKTALISTVENIIGSRDNIIPHSAKGPGTTPDLTYLNKLLKAAVKYGCEYVFMEATSIASDQDRFAGINFAGGIFTNLTHDHLDYHKTFENYFGAKKRFFQKLGKHAFALTNADDEYGLKMLEGIHAHSFSYGFNQNFDKVLFHGEIKKSSFDGLDLSFNKIDLSTKLLGKFNAYNLLAVWSACSLLGFDMDRVNKIIENIEPPRGRFQHFTSKSGVLSIVDYAHTPDALEKILTAIKEVAEVGLPQKGRIISVFGCGGDRDPLKRPVMGLVGANLSDIAIFTSDNPRSEDPDKILHQMTEKLSPEEIKKVKTIPDRREAIIEAVKLAQKGDVILVAGKGHEDYQEINGVKNHFDDMEELKKLYLE